MKDLKRSFSSSPLFHWKLKSFNSFSREGCIYVVLRYTNSDRSCLSCARYRIVDPCKGTSQQWYWWIGVNYATVGLNLHKMSEISCFNLKICLFIFVILFSIIIFYYCDILHHQNMPFFKKCFTSQYFMPQSKKWEFSPSVYSTSIHYFKFYKKVFFFTDSFYLYRSWSN